jgi:hypothetical protein
MEQPNWDDVVVAAITRKKKGSTSEKVFRLKLWWDHLPSDLNFSRRAGHGHTPTDGPSSCKLCALPGMVGSWHYLSACTATELIQLRREAAADILRCLHSSLAPRDPRLELWSGAFSCPLNVWSQPEGWNNQGDCRTGAYPNQWMGLFPREWRTLPPASPHFPADEWYSSGLRALVNTGITGLQHCAKLWKCACSLLRRARPRAPPPARMSKRRRRLEMNKLWAAQQEQMDIQIPLVRFNVERANRAAASMRPRTLAKRSRWTREEAMVMRWDECSLHEKLDWLRRREGSGSSRPAKQRKLQAKVSSLPPPLVSPPLPRPNQKRQASITSYFTPSAPACDNEEAPHLSKRTKPSPHGVPKRNAPPLATRVHALANPRSPETRVKTPTPEEDPEKQPLKYPP